MMEEDEKGFKFTTVALNSTECVTPTESLPPPPQYRRTWGNDSIHAESKRRDRGFTLSWKSRWGWSIHEHSAAASRAVISSALSMPKVCVITWRDAVWPVLRRTRITLNQSLALLLITMCGIIPMVVLGLFTSAPESRSGVAPFWDVFSDKTLDCGLGFYGKPQNSSVSGIEKLFVLDSTYGRLSFSQVKTIDVMWDLLVGRGVQSLAWWVAYNVFCDALLRVIERHPASFRIFQRIALEGPSLHSLWSLTKESWFAKDRKTRALLAYMLVAISYILCVPVFLGAMTGYDSTNMAWVDLDDTNNIVPASMMKSSWVITGTKNQTFDHPVCKDYHEQSIAQEKSWQRFTKCDCQIANGTIVPKAATRVELASWLIPSNCTYDWPDNTQTFVFDPQVTDYYNPTMEREPETGNCNSTIDVNVGGKTYDYRELLYIYGYCYDDIAYNSSYLYDKARCLPDTANPSYQWGFATMMSGIFVFITFGWCLSMYAIWQDAQFNSTLVKSGYRMTPLRAAFTMAKAATKRTGMGEKQLVRANTKDLEEELYGGKKTASTTIEYMFFVEDPEDGKDEHGYISRQELRARHARGVSEASAS